jgi:hypothetical protein
VKYLKKVEDRLIAALDVPSTAEAGVRWKIND